MLDGGMIRLPDPDTLIEGREDLPSSTQHCSECNGKLRLAGTHPRLECFFFISVRRLILLITIS